MLVDTRWYSHYVGCRNQIICFWWLNHYPFYSCTVE
jgi:hypothetical protein